MTHRRLWAITIACLVCWSATTFSAPAVPAGWKKQDIYLRLSGNQQIKAIYHPAGSTPRMMRDKDQPPQHAKRFRYPLRGSLTSWAGLIQPVMLNVIDSPPIDGFVPYIVTSVTNARSDDIDWAAYPESAITGLDLTLTPESDYAIGIFDTGASVTLFGYFDAISTGIYSHNLVTISTIGLSGATGTTTACVSYPLGLFAAGLGAIEPDGYLNDRSGMKGESNVSIIVGDVVASSATDLPTAIGAPFSVFYSTVFDNEHKVTRSHGSTVYTGPGISIYEPGDSAIPVWDDLSIPLELRPVSATGVSYIATVDTETFELYPQTPSIISDGASQSLFFVSSIDLGNSGHTAIDRNKFMLDTGAQVTVVGSAVAARLALNPKKPDFQVEIRDVTGEVTIKPGFYIDSLEIPALVEWFSATNVPVIYMDVASPEGGYLDGIIGTNLFTGYNMILRGGAFDDPAFLDIKLITNAADIAPAGGDGKVDMLDLTTLAAAWLSQTGEANWNSSADIAPAGGDGIINFMDFAVLTVSWDWVRGQ
jgi:hypothetical protein